MQTPDTPSEPTTPDAAGAAHRRQPLARGLELLALIIDSEQDSHGVRELAGRLGVSPSTAHRLITDLERLGMVTRTPSSTYQIGPEFLRLAWATSAQHPLQELATRTLQRLSEATRETSFFSSYNELRSQMMFTLTAESPQPLRYVIPLHEWLPLHAGASGLAILAFAPEAVQQRIIDGELEAQTERTVTAPDALATRLEQIRRDGYCVSRGERITGAVAIAAPVFRQNGVLGAAGISLPESRFDEAQLAHLAEVVTAGAAELTQYHTDPSNRFSRSPVAE
ncbi:IclR family transcriptional regulator [Leucobacter luti]|uniref:IclR family transcriptional regulator n=1 Tax=Leucobacter luti TaxID=340320 RepID=A0A4Q7U3A1_9MICO|nr:IclR family transcriptional regulator [Leucobacter luti]MBL3699548.1 IclR family transcriptional regulator [Leucobacter luti]RZT67060.1 IclR family transcriptional regulator [Leucobacter luti]